MMIFSGSYNSDDVIFLLKEIGDQISEESLEKREKAIQKGRHYSEMLPQEYLPSPEYERLFHADLAFHARRLALYVGVMSERILALRGEKIVLASLARAGTPIGVLVKRYIKQKTGLALPHYSISIIRDKGIDQNALFYILKRHRGSFIQFIDGWTGKGVIKRTLIEACRNFNQIHSSVLDDSLAVLADPGHCSEIFGTRSDLSIPSAYLNATVCGLISRTVLRADLIGQNDFHGVKYYRELAGKDLSNIFIEAISRYFTNMEVRAQKLAGKEKGLSAVSWRGMREIEALRRRFGVSCINFLKPGLGETTRVLLRRYPRKILVRKKDDRDLRHINVLAREKNIPVEVVSSLTFKACGIIREIV